MDGAIEMAWLIAAFIIPVLLVGIIGWLTIKRGGTSRPRIVGGLVVISVLTALFFYWSYFAF